MYPDWLSLTGKGYIASMYKQYGKVISPMGCRAFLSPWYERGGMHPADENDKPVFVGRFNIGAVSLHLPMILAKSRQENKDFFEVTKQTNLYEYGKDIIYNTEKMSLNKNVLNQKYYIVIPYYADELGQNSFDKEEIRNLSFSELYTRAQSIIRTIAACGVNAKVLNSDDLADLLYVAYNRDEAEVYGIDKALRAGFDELYSTAPDVLDKKIRILDKQIEEKAFEKANQLITEVKSEKQKAIEEKQENVDDLIDQLAKIILEENATMIGTDVAKDAINKIDKQKQNQEKGGETPDGQKTKRGRRKKTV